MWVMRVFRIRECAKIPVREHKLDAGMDLFYCPHPDGGDNVVPGDIYVVPPGQSCLLPTGIKVEVPKGHMLEVKNKSGIATKRQLVVGACVIDAGYDGEVWVNLHNLGRSPQKIMPGDKIAQAVAIPILYVEPMEELEDNLNQRSTRGDGGFGSTGL